MNTAEARLDALRKELVRQNLDGFVIPISDEHMSEYVGGYAQRLAWLTGFGGSAGTVAVLKDKAAIFVDGRYTLQVRDQVDGRLYAYESVPQTTVARWLGEQAPEGARIGYDAWLHGKRWAETAAKALAARGASLVAVAANPVDAIWSDRPAPSDAPALVHPDAFTGQPGAAKRAAVSAWLAEQKLGAVVISALDSIAWLLNIRGSDIERTPVALSFVIVHAGGTAELFIAPEKVTPGLRAHLGGEVTIRPREEFVAALQALSGMRVAADPERAVAAIFETLEQGGAEVVALPDPTVLPKALKNAVEQAGQRAAQARDGAAMVRFLHWLAVTAPTGTVSEIAAAEQVHQFRREAGDLRDLSFDTISGAGPNGAIVHYRVSEETCRTLEPGSVYLVDSGGQYPDGTTDITRTVWIGPDEPPAEVSDRFTRVLKGHIALDRAIFPKGAFGSQLDTLARQFLWHAGIDYAHGTGHGVGSFLSVHEGPQRISRNTGSAEQELLPGMILSNEPGYYKTGAFGIRIENLLLVEERQIVGAEGEFFGFETLTHVPIERRLLNTAILEPGEIAWWNAYHAQVLEIVGPQVTGDARAWLEEQCAPLFLPTAE
ncbi:MAG: aminopeptidase P family protein [Sphingomonadales bacterium]|nr:aminopeptidase P family protein [Sphingomonadales bacterium]MBU3991780.1 aminopeptidase P family protein [Alphaproteobacteria bacterium]